MKPAQENNLFEGVVTKKTIGTYFVVNDGQVIPCSISNRLRKELIYPTADPNSIRPHVVAVRDIQVVDPVAIGDLVQYVDAGDGTGQIQDVFPRKSKLARRAAVPMPSAHAFEQVIVANVDQVVPVISAAQPAPKWNLLDRYLISAEAEKLTTIVVITKMDLLSQKQRQMLLDDLDIYQHAGYHCLLTSVVSGEGLSELRQEMQDRLSVLLGKSGVGKSSLLNALQPGLGLRINEVSKKTGKGRHTTSHLEMMHLDFGGDIVDTPGMREFGTWEVDNSDLAYYFPEIRPFVGTCRFGLDCRHDSEPGCAVRHAVQAGEIHPRRYQSYLRLREG